MEPCRRPLSCAPAAVLLALALAACGEQGSERLEIMGGRDTDAQGLVIGLRGDGSTRFVRRVDGSVTRHGKARITADESVTITGAMDHSAGSGAGETVVQQVDFEAAD